MKVAVNAIVVSLLLGLGSFALSAEHPEHPTSQEHPNGQKMEHSKEHPKEHPKKPALDKAFQESFEKVVKEYVHGEAEKTGGTFTIHDDITNQDWHLELVKVHKNKICMLQEGKVCFACADFKEVGGKNKVDLDFYANKSEDGTMTMEKVLIHKVNGKPRFTYDAQNNIVPVK